jgi:AraC-like DNA-binding protein
MAQCNKKIGFSHAYETDQTITYRSDQCTVYTIAVAEGTGTMTSYHVFPGIILTYNDFHTTQCPRHRIFAADTLEINHCREGRFECAFNNGLNTYLGVGDLAVNPLANNRITNASFPLNHYHGISILIDLSVAASTISSVLQDISIDLYALRDRLCANNQCFIMRATDSIQHIFSELYNLPETIRHGYFKLKVLELFLFLSVIAPAVLEKRAYFPVHHVNIIKQIHLLITNQLATRFTLLELSERFQIPVSTLNSCFKAVYGMPVYAYIKSYRMQAAAAMLLNSHDNITMIAGNVGYENVSKFANAFKTIFHTSPSGYRKTR